LETITLNAPDISCGHCVATVENAVGKVNGVQTVSADETTRDINVTFDASQTDVSVIATALEEAGYPAKS
jgi:copper ion binding protein